MRWHVGLDGKLGGCEMPEQRMLFTAENAYGTLMAGFTTIQAVGAATDKPLRDFVARGVLPGPCVLTSLEPISGRTGTAEQIREFTRRQAAVPTPSRSFRRRAVAKAAAARSMTPDPKPPAERRRHSAFAGSCAPCTGQRGRGLCWW